MSNNKTQNKKTASEYEREKKHSQGEVTPMTVSGELRGLWKGILKSTNEQVLAPIPTTFSEQLVVNTLFGAQLQEGQKVSLKQQQAEKHENKAVASEHIEYFRTVNNADRIGETRTEQQIVSAVEQIRMEIQKLMKSSKIVEQTVKDATADKAPIKPGRYHLNFFEFVLSVLREATKKLDDTAAFGAVFTSKKQQSKYWNSYKKQGTTFGLSGERTVATQTG
jgi:hypothetical protein